EMGELRGGTVGATRDVLAEAIAEALAERKIDLADDAPVVLVMKYREEVGEELEEEDRRGERRRAGVNRPHERSRKCVAAAGRTWRGRDRPQAQGDAHPLRPGA